jgi:hypothetical protein
MFVHHSKIRPRMAEMGHPRRHSFGDVSGQPPIPDLSFDAGNDAKVHEGHFTMR